MVLVFEHHFSNFVKNFLLLLPPITPTTQYSYIQLTLQPNTPTPQCPFLGVLGVGVFRCRSIWV